MKAWHCFVDSYENGSLLVFAESRNMARKVASKSIFDWDYIEITAKRAKSHDGLRDVSCLIYNNDDLPEDNPFYSEY